MDDAKKYLTKGETSAGIIQLKNHLKKYPSDAEARHLLGKTYLKTREILQAKKELGRAHKLMPENELMRMDYAGVLLILKKYHDVINLLLDIHVLPEINERRLTLLGAAYMGLNQLAEAKSIYQLAVSDGYATANIGLATIAMQENELDKAVLFLDKILLEDNDNRAALTQKAIVLNKLKQHDKALLIYNQLIKEDAMPSVLHIERAATYLTLGQLSKAEDDLKYVLKKNKNSPSINFLMSRVKLAQKQFSEAKLFAEKVINIKSSHYPAILVLGISHYYLKSFNQSENYLIKYLAAQPDNVAVTILLAKVYLASKKPEQAILLLDDLYDREKNNLNLLLTLKLAYSQTGNHTKSLEMLNQAKKLNADSDYIKKSLILEQLYTGDMNKIIAELEAFNPSEKDSAQISSLLIASYILQGHFDAAEKMLNQLMAVDKNNAQLYLYQGTIEKYYFRYPQAEQAFKQALKIDKNFVTAFLALGKLAYEQRDIKQTKYYYHQVLAIDEKNRKAWFALAAIAEQEGDSAAVESALLNLYNKNKENIAIEVKNAILLSQFYIKNNTPQKIQKIAADLLKRHPKNIEAQSFMLDAHLLLNNDKDAEVLLRNIILHYPQKTKYQLSLAALMARQGNRDSEMNDVLNAVYIDEPDSTLALRYKIMLQMQSKQYEKALETAREISSEYPFLNVGEVLEGDIFWQMEEFEQALSLYKQAYRKYPDNVLAIKIADALIARQKSASAIEFLSDQVAEQDDNLTLLFKLARIYQQQEEDQQAINYYKQILKQQADNATVLNNLALIYFQANNPEALELAEKAHKKQPNSTAIADTYGVILLAHKEHKKALRVLRRGVRLAPDNRAMLFHLAQAYYANGDTNNAVRILERITQNPEVFTGQEQALALLKKIKK